MRPFQVAAPRGVVRTMHGVEVLALDVLDSRIRQRELVDHHAHGLAEARVVGAFVEYRRLDDQRLRVRQSRESLDLETISGLRMDLEFFNFATSGGTFMTHRFRNVIAVAAAAAWLSAPAGAQQPPQGQAHDHDAHHRDMLTRGAEAMGFDQERTVHHFLLYEDGGAIDVAVKEASDQANLQAVRQHLQDIAGLFKAGDFGKPALTHAQQVPGTVEMTRLKDRITYQYEETPAGGRVRIVTRDAAALAAVHAFLHFQIEDHHTGDSGVVQQISLRGHDARHGSRD